MTTNAIAISRKLAGTGMNKETAEMIAEAIVTHANENFATKMDIAELKCDIKALTMQIKISIALNIGVMFILLSKFVD